MRQLDLTFCYHSDRFSNRQFFGISIECIHLYPFQASQAQPIVVNSVHTTPAINTASTRSRESLTTSQLPPIASVAPVSHTTAHQAALQPHIQTQQVNVSSAVPASVNVTTSATPSHVCVRKANQSIKNNPFPHAFQLNNNIILFVSFVCLNLSGQFT